MKDQMKDVRQLIVEMMENIGDQHDIKGNKLSLEELQTMVQRGEATAKLSLAYIESVKTEVLAIRTADMPGYLPACMEAPKSIRQIEHDAQEKDDAPALAHKSKVSRIGAR